MLCFFSFFCSSMLSVLKECAAGDKNLCTVFGASLDVPSRNQAQMHFAALGFSYLSFIGETA